MYCPKCSTQNPDDGKFCRSCGANLSNVLAVVEGKISLESTTTSQNDYAELYSSGVRNVILGMGFLVTSIFLKLIPPSDGFFWLLFLIPAFCLTASGVSRILKAENLKKMIKENLRVVQTPSLSVNQSNAQLPPSQTDYVAPISNVQTNELVSQPVSVTENTTRHLEKHK